jgi:hypothetical protein
MPNYIHLPFERACSDKWERGVRLYRKDPAAPFNGDLLEEMFQECLDLHNYLSEPQQLFNGAEAAFWKATFKQFAYVLQAQHKRLNGQ